MSYEYLRSVFGTNDKGEPVALTFDEFVAKLGETKEVKLVNLSDGGYVSEDKFKAKETELKGVREQLDAANSTIQSYKDMDIDGIKQSAADWEKKYKDDTAALNQKIADNERAYNEELFLRNYKFSSKAAAAGIKDEFVKRKFPYEDGTFIGGKEFIEKLMSDEDYKAAFVVDAPDPSPAPDTVKPKPQFTDPNPQPTPPPKRKTLTELMMLKNANPNATIKYD